MDADRDSDGEFYDCVEDVDEIGKFYALSLPQEKWTDRKGLIAVDFKEAMKKLKEFKGARLKVFAKMHDALRFAETPAESLVSPQSKDKTRMRRDVDPFPNVSQRDLNELRSAIDRGEIQRISDMVWNNPRHLVNESDFPTVLQIRFRYNAVHECCYRGQGEVLKKILSLLESDDYWRTLHPTVDESTHAARRRRILDLFLNSPDTGCLETPLHFAAKFGHVECAEVLVEKELVCTTPRNREGRTPAEIVCTRCTSAPDRAERRRRILDVLRGQFVLLVAGEGGEVQVLAPCDWRTFRSWRRQPERLRAFAGPMSSEESQQFRQLLKRPLRKLGKIHHAGADCSQEYELFSARLVDSEKGFERAGRHLAAKFAVSWMEYWPFLGDYVDLTSDSGLSILEDHVQTTVPAWHDYREGVDFHSEDTSSSLDLTPASNGDMSGLSLLQTNNSSTQATWLSPLTRLFSRLSVRSPPPTQSSLTPSDTNNLQPEIPSSPPPAVCSSLRAHFDAVESAQSCPPPPLVTSTPIRKSRAPPRRSRSERQRRSLTGASEGLAREDMHVFRALSQLDAGRLARFPHVRQWRDDVSEDLGEMSEELTASAASPRRANSWHQPISMVT